jgi:hypothetical protein
MTSSPAPTPPNPLGETEEQKEARRREKEARRLEEARGVLDPESRYKALYNTFRATQDLIEMGDKKARFALVIISVLNAVALLLFVRGGENLLPRGGGWGLLVTIEITAYVVGTIYYIGQAIDALRPRGIVIPSESSLPSAIEPATSMRVLFYGDVVARSRESYRRVWSELRMDNLQTELADQVYTLATINQRKYEALTRLYTGVAVMTAMLGGIIATIGAYRLWP